MERLRTVSGCNARYGDAERMRWFQHSGDEMKEVVNLAKDVQRLLLDFSARCTHLCERHAGVGKLPTESR